MKLIYFLILFAMIVVSIDASEIIVDKNSHIKSIKQAIELAQKNDTIVIHSGTYNESFITIDKPLTLLGKDYPIVDGKSNGEVFYVTSANVTIKGLLIKGSEVSFLEEYAGVHIEEVENCVIENNKFENNFFGIYLTKSSHCIIRNNIIEGVGTSEATTGNGIHLWYCKNIEILDNTITGQRDGIYFEFVENCTIKNNNSHNNLRYGLHFMFSDSCTYSHNIFAENNSGVAVMYSKYVTMYENKFYRNWGGASYGLLLKEITDSKLYNNLFLNNSIGLYMEGCNRIIIKKNNFTDNGWAVKIMSNSEKNVFSKNNFRGNSFQVSTNSRNNFSNFDGNFWSTYRGYDLDWDGIGDIPYRPVNLFSLIVERYPSTLILHRSLIIDVLNLAERAIPSLTPETLTDEKPLMEPVL